MEESVVGLVFRVDVSLHLTLGQRGLSVQDDHTSHRIRAVHQRGGTFQYLNAADAAAINLNTVFVAPLLTLLTHTFAHHHDAVVAQSADDRFRDAAACCQLADARLVSDGIDDICRSRGSQHLRCHDTYGGCGVFQLGIARHTRHRQFIQLQMTEKNICRILRMMMFTIILSCHCRAYTQQ